MLATDTDSMAIVTDYRDLEKSERLHEVNRRPDALPLLKVYEIVELFRALWPYKGVGNILKLEEENFDPERGGHRPLYAIAIAAKRFCLFNFDDEGRRVVRKRSEHGLGLFVSPYGAEDKKKQWIDELWEDVIDEVLGLPVEPRPWHDHPVVGRVPVTSWELLKSFETYNRAHPEAPVKPFNFVSAAYPKPLSREEPVRLFAPFVSEPAQALEAQWYEHNTGRRVAITTEDSMGEVVDGLVPVKTYGEHPEVKFADEDGHRCHPRTSGTLTRRHVIATRTEPYGKEGNALRRRVEGAGVSDETQGLFVDPADFERHVLPVARAMSRRGSRRR